MEVQFIVTARVSDRPHAEKIKDDIEFALRFRTPIYHVSDIRGPKKTIDQLCQEEK